MPIEFNCTNCKKPIRVGDEAAGKRGKCPRCGAILQIPAAAASSPAHPTPGNQPAGKNLSFPCPGCGKTITAPASLAGKRGKCPHCQMTLVIGGKSPAPLVTPPKQDLHPLPGPDLLPLSGAAGGDLFADLAPSSALPPLEAKVLPGGPPLNPLGISPTTGRPPQAAFAANPYASPAPGVSQRITAPLKLTIPAALLFLVSLVTIGANMVSAINTVTHPERAERFIRARSMEQFEAMKRGYVIGAVIGAVVSCVLNAAVMAGALQMVRMRGWEMARAGATIALIPCCSIACLNIPLGIWALIILNQPDVRRQFQ